MSPGRFTASLAAALLVPVVANLLVAALVFGGEFRGVEASIAGGYAVVLALTLAVQRNLAAPVQRALARASALPPPERRAAAMAALRLPGRMASALAALWALLVAAIIASGIWRGFPADVAVVAAATGVAFGIMASMLAYSVSANAMAPALVRLGSVDVSAHGSLRSKVLVVCYGVLAIAGLLVGATSYAWYRSDADASHVEAAVRTQASAAEGIAARGPAEVAERIWADAGAPTLVAGSGGVVARAGLGHPAWLDQGPPGTGVDRVEGGWRLRRAAGGLQVVSFLPEAPLALRRLSFWRSAFAVGAIVWLAASVLVWAAARTLTVPIGFLGDAADRMASGDLTATTPSVTRDEIGKLAGHFRRMTQGLSGLVADVQEASRGVEDGAREVNEIGQRVRGGARDERDRVLGVEAAVQAMHGSVVMVGRGVDGLSEYVSTTSAAVGQMAAALEDVQRQGSELERLAGSASQDVERLSEAGRRSQALLGNLDGLAGQAKVSLETVGASLSGLEQAAVGSQLAAAQAAEMADHAGVVVQEAVAGIESLRATVGDAKSRVAALGRRSDDVDQVLDFIDEVAGRTNLLSLNASIIATQAGEHGKAFAVVADQIRELAAQISRSTKSIGGIIGAVRDDVAGTARHIEQGDELAAEGVALARRSLDALQAMRSATAAGHRSAAGIRDAVQSHAQSTRDVGSLVASVAESSKALAEATQMVSASADGVDSLTRGVRALADKVSRALEQQSGVGRRQLESLERIDAMLGEIGRAVESHEEAARRVRESLVHLGKTAEQHESAVVQLAGLAERLGGRSRALAERVGRFRV